MAVIVSILGALIVLIGIVSIISPAPLIHVLKNWHSPARFWFAVVIRLALGAVLLAVAADCRAPLVVQIVGVISIVAAVSLLVFGRARLDSFIEWWLGRPGLIRISGVAALAFGILLLYAGA